MGLLILSIVGALFGWLATIILRVEDGKGILAHALAGTAGSVVTGLFVGKGAIFGTVSGMALLWAVIGSIVAIGLFSFVRRRAIR